MIRVGQQRLLWVVTIIHSTKTGEMKLTRGQWMAPLYTLMADDATQQT